MGFKSNEVDPCVYTRDDNEQRYVVCLYVDDMLIASRVQDVIISVKAQIAEKLKIKELGHARFILGVEIDYNMEDRKLGICQQLVTCSDADCAGNRDGQGSVSDMIVMTCGMEVESSKDFRPKFD
ncbi:unnamed protein product [Phytophthora fragariaefolia]|uniref:Unnamed protein product n=1 Tax=Phytophthora fragariaefolia TaxID=1490495 RepID=A0A9W7CT98_9STRA|nr:unnamed protein product [Phytophthora fragariaefolia]